MNFPKNEIEFNVFMEQIDDVLKKKDVKIFQRPLYAIKEACTKLNINDWVVSYVFPVPGKYNAVYLAAHIEEWYKKRYGDRIGINFSPGSVAVLIKEDPWKIELPLIFGKVNLVFDPEIDKYDNAKKMAVNSELYINALRSVCGLTKNFAKSLSKTEMEQLAQFYLFALKTIQHLSEVKDRPYISEARSDLNMAVSNIFSFPPNYGQSKWATLQFTEKLIKSFLKLEEVDFPKTHDLEKLANLAFQNGLQIINQDLFKIIRCPAAARYGEINLSLQDAIIAHHASLEVCSIISQVIKKYDPLSTECFKSVRKIKPGIIVGQFYVMPSLNFYYYCDRIERDLVYWILIESYQYGDLIQVEFSAFLNDSKLYLPVLKERKIRQLEEMLIKLKTKSKDIKL